MFYLYALTNKHEVSQCRLLVPKSSCVFLAFSYMVQYYTSTVLYTVSEDVGTKDDNEQKSFVQYVYDLYFKLLNS